MAQYRKKPIVIEAVQWDGNRLIGDVPPWIGEALAKSGAPDTQPGCIMRIGDEVHIGTLEGVMIASSGDWIIRGIKGEIYPCKPDIFEASYELASGPSPSGDGWQDTSAIPPVKHGGSKEYVIAVYRARSSKVYSFSAEYLNAYPLTFSDGCPKGKSSICDECEDGCPTTGWFSPAGNDDDGTTYHHLSLSDGDKIVGWREIPQWSAPPSTPQGGET